MKKQPNKESPKIKILPSLCLKNACFVFKRLPCIELNENYTMINNFEV